MKNWKPSDYATLTVIVCFHLWCVFCLTFWQHLRLYQGGYRLVTVCTHGNFIVLPYWETRPPGGLNNAEHLARMQQVSIYQYLLWLDQEPISTNLPHARTLHYRFGNWSGINCNQWNLDWPLLFVLKWWPVHGSMISKYFKTKAIT